MRSAALASAWARSLSTIRGRLVLSFILIALVAIGIVGGVSGLLVKHFVERRESAYLESNASTVAQRALSLMVPVVRPLSLGDLARTAAFISDSRIRILDREQRVLADSGPPYGTDNVWVRVVATINVGDAVVRHRVWIPVTSDPVQIARLRRSLPVLERRGDAQALVVRRRSGLWGSFIEFQDYDGPLLAAIAREDAAPADDTMRNIHVEPIGDPANPAGYVEIARSPDVPGEALETIITPFIIAALAATILAAVLGLVFGRRLTAPIEGLTASAVRMGSGDLAARAPSIGDGEIGELGRQFNAMAGKLESTVRDLRQERDVLRRFVADASHELRTPVTALKTFNELLLDGAQRDAGAADPVFRVDGAAPVAGTAKPAPRDADGVGGVLPPWRRPVAAAAALAAGLGRGTRRGGRKIDAQTPYRIPERQPSADRTHGVDRREPAEPVTPGGGGNRQPVAPGDPWGPGARCGAPRRSRRRGGRRPPCNRIEPRGRGARSRLGRPGNRPGQRDSECDSIRQQRRRGTNPGLR